MSIEPFLMLKASAGSGKTFALTIRYISLLFSGATPGEILTITFTKKATKEMQDRIKKALYEIANSKQCQESIFLDALLKEGFSKEHIIKQAPRIYEEFLVSNTRISTIDSFVNMVLRKFCWYVGLSLQFQSGSAKNTDKITELFLQNIDKQDFFQFLVRVCADLRLDFSAFEAFVKKCYGDKIYFSNETLQGSSRQPAEIKAMQSSIKALENKILTQLCVLKSWLLEQGVSQGANAIKTESFYEVLNARTTWLEKGRKYRDFKILRENDNLGDIFDEKLALIRALFYQYFQMREKIIFSYIALVVRSYEQANNACIRKDQKLDFNDCNIKAYDLLALGKGLCGLDPLFFYFRLDNKINHILVDEFQDTNPMQYAILKPLIDEIKSGVGQRDKFRSVFFVGDEKQSIYRFRGSDSGIFTKAKEGMKIENLKYNWRSFGNVLDFINDVFSKIYQKYEPQKLPPSDSASLANKGFVNVKLTQDVPQEVLRSVKELLDSKVNPNEVAILCFKNDDGAEVYATLKEHFEKEKRKIDIVFEERKNALQKRGIKALASALSFLSKSQKALDSINLIAEPAMDANPIHQAQESSKKAQKFFLYDFLKLCGFEVFNIKDTQLDNLKKRLLNCYDVLPRKCILKVMQEFEIFDKSAQLFLQNSIAYKSIDEFLADLEYIEWNLPKEAHQGLKIMTIHSSKGLEFEYVIVCDRLSKKRPNDDKIIFGREGEAFVKESNRDVFDEEFRQAEQYHEQKDEEEENNVLYVASTRGKKGLIIVAKNELYASGDKKGQLKSAFKPILEHIQEKMTNNELRIGEIIPSSKESIIKSINPTLLKQQSFGKQEIEIISEDLYNLRAIDIKNIYFGQALHLGLEYALGFGIDMQKIRQILCYAYGQESLDSIMKRISNFGDDEMLKNIIKDKRVFVELPILIDSKLRRIDFFALNDTQAVIVDYKSGFASQDDHIKQVASYIQGMQNILPNHSISGYIAYVCEKTQWQKVES